MGYSIFKIGTLYQGAEPKPIPQDPWEHGDIPQYNPSYTIFIGPTFSPKAISWIKPDGMSILVSDRVLLNNVSWQDLNSNTLVYGTEITLGGTRFRCRLLQVNNAYNEWNQAMTAAGTNDNKIWNWSGIYSWSQNAHEEITKNCIIVGLSAPKSKKQMSANIRHVSCGYRPVLEILPSHKTFPTIKLDGQDFFLSNIPGGTDICPILQPYKDNVFADIRDGQKVWMYTLLLNGKPVCTTDDGVHKLKETDQIQMTDKYFGDEFLIPWTITNGLAVADKALMQRA